MSKIILFKETPMLARQCVWLPG